MKKMLHFIIVCILFIPLLVNAETCDNDKISISSITLENKSDSVEELSEATAKGRNVNLDLNMVSVGGNIEYKITVKNSSNEDYIIDNSTFNLDSDYIDYTIESMDNSNIVKAKSSKTVNLRIQYNKKVSSDDFTEGKYNKSSTMVVNLSTNSLMDMITNPNTGSKIVLFILFILTIGVVYTIVVKKKKLRIMIIIVGLLLIVPISVYAACKVEIKINSNIQIVNKGYMPCTFDGEMVPGAEFAYGDFIYRYKQEYNLGENSGRLEWININEDGWGVIHKDIKSSDVTGEITPKMCSSINGKPIVSMSYTFYKMDKISKMDASYIDTSNVINMDYTFKYFGSETPGDANGIRSIELTGLEEWDTSKVRSMEGMFEGVGTCNNRVIITDMSYWDTSNVENFLATFEFLGEGMYDDETTYDFNVKGFENWSFESAKDVSYMFSYFGASFENAIIDVSKWDVSNIEIMEGLFEGFGKVAGVAKIIGLSNWDVSNVEDMTGMFLCFGTEAGVVDIGDISNWDVSNVKYMSSMFCQFASYSSVASVGDLSRWDVSNVTTMSSMFTTFGFESDTIKFFDLSNWDVSNVKTMVYMFREFGGNYDIPINISNWDLSNVYNMDFMFNHFGANSNRIHDLGTINVYSDSINGMFLNSHNVKAVLNIYSNPEFNKIESGMENRAFFEAATAEGSLITLNYSNNTTNIDDIIATKSDNSNVVKGNLLD